MRIRSHIERRLGRLGLAVAGLALLAPASASAAKAVSDYHPAEGARNFATGPGGWQGEKRAEGACVEGITCPAVATTHESGGGTEGAGDGHLRTEISNLAGTSSTSRGVWTSPEFVYRGVGGQEPTSLNFELARRTDLEAFLGTGGNSATYTVQLVQAGSGVARTLVDESPLGANEEWARTSEVAVPRSSLEIGRSYRVRIISIFRTEADVFPASSVDYDDVRLRAVLGDGSGAGNGGNGGNGGGSAGGGPGNGALIKGNRLFLRLKCLGVKEQGRCKVRAVAYERKRGARMTFPVERRVKAKKGKVVALRIRPRFVKQLSERKRVLVRSKIRADEERKVKFKRYRLAKR